MIFSRDEPSIRDSEAWMNKAKNPVVKLQLKPFISNPKESTHAAFIIRINDNIKSIHVNRFDKDYARQHGMYDLAFEIEKF